MNAAGHSAPVRSLLFVPPDGSFLLSGGMDKVVNVWDLRNPRPVLAQTLRPRIWRGNAGTIYAMALSPAGPDGQRVLAVAGFGVDANRGEINLFRFPGAHNRPTGDLIGQLSAGNNAEAPPKGHIGNVTCLAFDPTGRFLASGSFDSTIRFWDVANRATLAVLRGHAQGTAVNSLAFTPDGTRLFSGSGDGRVILWDVNQRLELGHVVPNPERHRDGPAGAAINLNMLAVTRDGNWVVIGRENGDLIRYDSALRTEVLLNPREKNAQGPVESLAISPDGSTLATSAIRTPVAGSERPRPECVIELRRLPDGQVLRLVAETSNLALRPRL